MSREGGNQVDGELHMFAGEIRTAAREQALRNLKCCQRMLERPPVRQMLAVIMSGARREIVGCHHDDQPTTLAFASSSLRLPLQSVLSAPHRHLRVRPGSP